MNGRSMPDGPLDHRAAVMDNESSRDEPASNREQTVGDSSVVNRAVSPSIKRRLDDAAQQSPAKCQKSIGDASADVRGRNDPWDFMYDRLSDYKRIHGVSAFRASVES